MRPGMKVILSRKGFDATLGKCPSPLFPSGELVSLPIPETRPAKEQARLPRYADLQAGEIPLGGLVRDLSRRQIQPTDRVHLDPERLSYHRHPHRWHETADGVQLQSVGRGQEFVLDCHDYPEALAWLQQIYRTCP